MSPITELSYEEWIKECGFADTQSAKLAYKILREEEEKNQKDVGIPSRQRKPYSEEEKSETHYREHC